MENSKIVKLISAVEHPAINLSLKELGIISKIEVKDNEVNVEYAFPFPNIPIKDVLVGSVQNVVESNNFTFNYSIRNMTEDEITKFMELENKNWRQ